MLPELDIQMEIISLKMKSTKVQNSRRIPHIKPTVRSYWPRLNTHVMRMKIGIASFVRRNIFHQREIAWKSLIVIKYTMLSPKKTPLVKLSGVYN